MSNPGQTHYVGDHCPGGHWKQEDGLVFYVAGTPAPQGSKRIGRAGGRRDGKPLLIESSAKVGPWRKAIAFGAREAMTLRGATTFSGPVYVRLEFVLKRPLKTTKPDCDTKPDVDKLARSTLDGLTGLLWKDDAQVVRLTASKRWTRPNGLERPGVLVTVQPWPDL